MDWTPPVRHEGFAGPSAERQRRDRQYPAGRAVPGVRFIGALSAVFHPSTGFRSLAYVAAGAVAVGELFGNHNMPLCHVTERNRCGRIAAVACSGTLTPVGFLPAFTHDTGGAVLATT